MVKTLKVGYLTILFCKKTSSLLVVLVCDLKIEEAAWLLSRKALLYKNISEEIRDLTAYYITVKFT